MGRGRLHGQAPQRRTPRPHDGEEGAANAVRVNDRVLVSDSYPLTAALLARAGYKVVALQTREIAKIDDGVQPAPFLVTTHPASVV